MPSNRYEQAFREADEAFNGRYRNELNDLMGLSREEIDSLTPDTEDRKAYTILVKVVEKASRENADQAELVEDIKELGGLGVKLAKKVSGLASLF